MSYDEVETTLYVMLLTMAVWVAAVGVCIAAAKKANKKGWSFWAVVFITVSLIPSLGPGSSLLAMGISMLLPRR